MSDRNIPFVAEAFAELGTVVTMPAAEIDAASLRDADLLLCRTTIKVGPALLEGSKVRFVATATIGTDHLDLPYLAARGIPWASAPGSNADSVALWWAAAMATLCRKRAIDITALRIGVVGVGHVGKRIAALARALGPAPILCDPPRARAEGFGFTELDALLAASDVISLHVPLSDEGVDRTRGLITAARLAALRPGTILINACRGEIVDGAALTISLASGQVRGVLDVFPGEPSPDPALIAAAELATPHIAGHSLDGKVNGTDAIYRAACAFLGRPPGPSVTARLSAVAPARSRRDASRLRPALPRLRLLRRIRLRDASRLRPGLPRLRLLRWPRLGRSLTLADVLALPRGRSSSAARLRRRLLGDPQRSARGRRSRSRSGRAHTRRR